MKEKIAFYGFLIACVAAACGSSSSSTTTSGTGTTAASCTDVCNAVTNKCGSAMPQCDQNCASLSSIQKNCSASAATCNDIAACFKSTDTTTEDAAAPKADTGPSTATGCTTCKVGQFCVSAKNGDFLRCYDAPSSCNGTDNLCPCLVSAANGPCPNGGSRCSQGAGDYISCNP